MDKYEVKKIVGEGSYGKALLCNRKVDRKQCIIKQISVGKMSKKEQRLTQQEADLLKNLHHPNIVQFWDSFFTGSHLYIVMEFADGGDLDSYIKNFQKKNPGKEMPESQVLNIFVQLCLAIKHIHDRKILHRDLKGQNVFMTSSGLCKVGDFGVSRVLRSTMELAATQIGTPYYMSPEIMNNQRYNSKTDIWSLGIILYELVCLRLPFQGSSMRQLCYNIINATPAPPSSRYSPELRDLVSKILTKDPKLRPGINNILARPIMKNRIRDFLNETKFQNEFNHTVFHGMNVLNSQHAQLMAGANAAPPKPIAAPVVSAGANIPRPISNNIVASNPLLAPPIRQLQQQPQQIPAPARLIPSSSPVPPPSASPYSSPSPPLPKGPPPAGMVVPVKKPDVSVNAPIRKPGEIVNIPNNNIIPSVVVKPAPPPSVAINYSNNNNNNARLRIQMKPPIPSQQQLAAAAPSSRPQSNNQIARPSVGNPSSAAVGIQKPKPVVVQQPPSANAPSSIAQILQPRSKPSTPSASPLVPAQQNNINIAKNNSNVAQRAATADGNNANNHRRKSFPDQDAQSVASNGSKDSRSSQASNNSSNVVKGNKAVMSNNNPFEMIVGPANVHAPLSNKYNNDGSNHRKDAAVVAGPRSNHSPVVVPPTAVYPPLPSAAGAGQPVVVKRAGISTEDRLKEVDMAVNKVAQMMQNLKASPLNVGHFSPPPPVVNVATPSPVHATPVAPVSRPGVREPSFAAVGSAVLARPASSPSLAAGVKQPPSQGVVKTPLSEKEKEENLSWLSDLQNQMGALKQQVHIMQQQNKSPLVPSPIPTPVPTPAAQQRVSPVPSGNKNYAVKRQSFPVAAAVGAGKAGRVNSPPPSGLDAPRSVASVNSNYSQNSHHSNKSNVSNNNNNAKAKKHIQQGRASDPKYDGPRGNAGGVGGAKKPISQPSPSISPVPAVDLDQRRELREKHKMGFREFLRQQRGSQDDGQTAASSKGEEGVSDSDTVASSECSTPVLFAPPPPGNLFDNDCTAMLSPPPSSIVSSLQQSQRSVSSLSSIGTAVGSVKTTVKTAASQKGSSSSSTSSSTSLRKFIENQRRAAAHHPHNHDTHVTHNSNDQMGLDTAVGSDGVLIYESSHRYTPPPSAVISSSVAPTTAGVSHVASAAGSEWIEEEMFTYVKPSSASLEESEAPMVQTPPPVTPQGKRNGLGDGDDVDDDDERPTDPQVRPSGLQSYLAEGDDAHSSSRHVAVSQPHAPIMEGRNMAAEFLEDEQEENTDFVAQEEEEEQQQRPSSMDGHEHGQSLEFLGKSFVLQMRDEDHQAARRVLDAQAAMEYSLMIQQMQEILQLGAAKAKELDAANYDSSSTSRVTGTSGSVKKNQNESRVNGQQPLTVIAEGTEEEQEDEEEEIEEGFEEASFTFYLSDSDEDNDDHNGKKDDEEDEDVNEFGEEYLKEIADPRDEDIVASSVPADYDGVCPETPSLSDDTAAAIAAEPLFKRTDPAVFAQLGRPPRPSVTGNADLTDLDEDILHREVVVDPLNDTTRNFTSTAAATHDVTPSQDTLTAGGGGAISAESEALLQASLSKTQKQRIYQKLEKILGSARLEKGLQFLSSTYLEDENADEEYLLNMLEAIVGTENLYCLEDMYYILSI